MTKAPVGAVRKLWNLTCMQLSHKELQLQLNKYLYQYLFNTYTQTVWLNRSWFEHQCNYLLLWCACWFPSPVLSPPWSTCPGPQPCHLGGGCMGEGGQREKLLPYVSTCIKLYQDTSAVHSPLTPGWNDTGHNWAMVLIFLTLHNYLKGKGPGVGRALHKWTYEKCKTLWQPMTSLM